MISRWCADCGLRIVREKTEVIFLTGKRIPKVIETNVEGYLLTTRQEVKYLGVQLDCNRSFGAHLEKVCGKADTLMGAFRSLLPNIDGPTGSVRKLNCRVWESMVLYATLVWGKVVEIKKNRNILKRAPRAALTRVSMAYRTASHAALYVLMGIMPIYFTAALRTEKYRIGV
ncbi:uncharacterized protein LOC105680933 [Bombus impatiens]|uniref:Uncharacterized protein LOC105680933 n=1 Tax=Bombus impatiens TaxID=132113 RepID=A0A6P3UW65_BOMIM|nr:uncharacterized protein LOC105680933 [Bombus impatiens]